MKKFFAMLIFATIFLTGCGESAEKIFVTENEKIVAEKNIIPQEEIKIKIQIGDKIFNATMEDHPAARKFVKNLPLEVTMTELNGNEKYFRFDKTFPSSDKKIGTIHNGDLMLWSSNTVVLFYKDFSTSYSYTRLGKIENPADLEKILGAGNVSVKFYK